MNEFTNRIAIQREILNHVNSGKWTEELYGLSTGAIDRWLASNKLEKNSEIAKLITMAAEKLFFLANKSQEQITNDYKKISKEATDISNSIKNAMSYI